MNKTEQIMYVLLRVLYDLKFALFGCLHAPDYKIKCIISQHTVSIFRKLQFFTWKSNRHPHGPFDWCVGSCLRMKILN